MDTKTISKQTKTMRMKFLILTAKVKFSFTLLLAVFLGFSNLTSGQTTETLTTANNGQSPWVVPAGVSEITVKIWGAGGGSGGHGTSGVTAGGLGGTTTFGALTAGGGAGSAGATNNTPTTGGGGGTDTGGSTKMELPERNGTIGCTSTGGNGGASPYGGVQG